MTSPRGIVPLLKAYKDQALSKDAFLEGLSQIARLLEQKKAALAHNPVIARDRDKWETMLRPGLEACFDVLIATAGEAAVYAEAREEQILYNVVHLLSQVDKATEILMGQLGDLDQSTASMVKDNLDEVEQHQDALATAQLNLGQAQNHISLFD